MLSNILSIIGILLTIISIPAISVEIKKIKKRNRLFFNRFFYTKEQVNRFVSSYDFTRLEPDKFINDTDIFNYYSDDLAHIKIRRNDKTEIIPNPYKEVVNFITQPNAKIYTSSIISKEFVLPPEILVATQDSLDEYSSIRPELKNDLHPRIASFHTLEEGRYECELEKADYFKQIRTNITIDYPIIIESFSPFPVSMRAYDRKEKGHLPSFEESVMANTIGVSAIWVMGDLKNNPRFFFLPRKKTVMFGNTMGIPSGSVEYPKDDCLHSDLLNDYMKLEIAREFAEETGIGSNSIKIDEYYKPVSIYHRVKMDIYPLAFLREMKRGGKPQFFFLIVTPEIPIRKIKKCFRRSKGKKEEFDNSVITSLKLSSESIWNYIYAQSRLQNDIARDYIDLS